jgi:hypothetical protein
MRNLFFVIAMFFVGVVNSQVIKIEVSGVVDAYGYDTSVFNFINNDSLVYEYRKVNSTYNIDLTNKSYTHIKNNVVLSEGEITFDDKDGVILVKFLIGGYNIWMVINTNIDNEQVTWFSNTDNFIELTKFTDFLIVKSF